MLELVEVVDDFGAGPVLGGDEFSAEGAFAVDDVGFGDLDGAVESVDLLGGIAEGDEIDMVLGEEVLVCGVVLVHADGDDGDLGEAALHFEEAGELFDTGCAPGGPEVENDDAAAELAEIDGFGAVGDYELRGGAADVAGMIATIAACGEQGA